jgi:hypothetical protein
VATSSALDQHDPPLGTDRGAESAGHRRSQIEPPEQLSEHDPVHLTWHSDAPVHVTLLFGPTVTTHVDMSSQSMWQDASQVPTHTFWLSQASKQLALPPHVSCVKSQAFPPGHEQLPAVQLGNTVESSIEYSFPQPRQPAASRTPRITAARISPPRTTIQRGFVVREVRVRIEEQWLWGYTRTSGRVRSKNTGRTPGPS